MFHVDHKEDKPFLLRIKLQQSQRMAEELKNEASKAKKEHESLERKYREALDHNNTLWNVACKIKGGLEAFRNCG